MISQTINLHYASIYSNLQQFIILYIIIIIIIIMIIIIIIIMIIIYNYNTIYIYIWVNYNNSLTWIVRPFGDDVQY